MPAQKAMQGLCNCQVSISLSVCPIWLLRVTAAGLLQRTYRFTAAWLALSSNHTAAAVCGQCHTVS